MRFCGIVNPDYFEREKVLSCAGIFSCKGYFRAAAWLTTVHAETEKYQPDRLFFSLGTQSKMRDISQICTKVKNLNKNFSLISLLVWIREWCST